MFKAIAHFSVPTGSMQAFSVLMYLHNITACQTSAPMCLCSTLTEVCVHACKYKCVWCGNYAWIFPTARLLFSLFMQSSLPKGNFSFVLSWEKEGYKQKKRENQVK